MNSSPHAKIDHKTYSQNLHLGMGKVWDKLWRIFSNTLNVKFIFLSTTTRNPFDFLALLESQQYRWEPIVYLTALTAIIWIINCRCIWHRCRWAIERRCQMQGGITRKTGGGLNTHCECALYATCRPIYWPRIPISGIVKNCTWHCWEIFVNTIARRRGLSRCIIAIYYYDGLPILLIFFSDAF